MNKELIYVIDVNFQVDGFVKNVGVCFQLKLDKQITNVQ